VLKNTKNSNDAFKRLFPTLNKPEDLDLYHCNVKPANDFPSKYFNKVNIPRLINYSA